MKHERWKVLLGAAAFVAAVGLAGPPVWAVDEGVFELEFDANALSNNAPPAGVGDDWQDLWEDCGNDGIPDGLAVSCGNSSVFTGILSDPSGVTIYTGGNKDIKDLPELGITSGSTPPKSELQHGFAAAYTCPGGGGVIDCVAGDTLIYFGADRDSNNGDTFVGLWLFQGEVGLTSTGFTGTKTTKVAPGFGDLLILANFPQASNAVPSIQVLEWDVTCAKKAGPNISNGQCAAENLRQIDRADGDGEISCETDGANPHNPDHLFCARVNTTDQTGGTASPWGYTTVLNGFVQGDYPEETFFEGGLNLTALTGGACVASFAIESRSSSSPTAQLKDVLGGGFPLCSVSGAKSCTADPGAGNGFCLIEDKACPLGNECTMAGDRCITTNPYLKADGVTINMENDVVITNDGAGDIFDVEIKENTLFDLNSDSCAIVAVGGQAVSPIDLPVGTGDNDWTTIPTNVGGSGYNGTLASGASLTVLVECMTENNPYGNQVDIRAASSDGGAFNVFDSNIDLNTSSDACQVAAMPGIGLAKSCVDVRLMTMDTELVVEVLTEITVSNTGDEQLEAVTVTDSVGGTLTPAGGITLAPGASATYMVTDMPQAPGQTQLNVCSDTGTRCTDASTCGDPTTATCGPNTSGSKYDPDGAIFSNLADASGRGTISNNVVNAVQQSANCPLCPTTP